MQSSVQDMDPSRRPGAGPGGYAILKNHPFFKGIDWTSLREGKTPPTLALEPRSVRLFFVFPCMKYEK